MAVLPLEPCVGGGTVPQSEAPPPTPNPGARSMPLAWVEVTFPDGVERWAAVDIPHGPPKVGRVVKFGTVTRRLTDGDGGPQAATVTTQLIDTDRKIRCRAFLNPLQHALVEYYIADLAFIEDGLPGTRIFRGRIQSWTADANLQVTLHVEDDLTARLTSSDAVDVKSPQRVIDTSIHDFSPARSTFQKPAPEIYGALTDSLTNPELDQGTLETHMTQSVTLPEAPNYGNMPMFLVCAGVVKKIGRIYAADPNEDPPVTRIPVDESAFGNWLLAPGYTNWPLPNPWYETSSGRWTVLFGKDGHPVIEVAAQGRVPITVDVCGYDHTGDALGTMIDSPARAFLHWFNNRLMEDVKGNWVTSNFALGDYSLFDTASFEAVHWRCLARGCKIAGALGFDLSAMSWRDRVAEFCRNFGWDLGTNRHGQIMLLEFDPTADTTNIPLLTPGEILERGCEVEMHADAVENIVPYSYAREYLSTLQDRNPAEGARGLREPHDADWRSGLLEVRDNNSIDALGGSPRGERRAQLQEYSLIRDASSAAYTANARLKLHALPNGRADVTFDLWLRDGYPLELGDIVRLEHWDLPWEGARRCQVRSLETDLDLMIVTVTVRDVEDLYTYVEHHDPPEVATP